MIYFSKTNRNDEKRALRTLDSVGFIILRTPKQKRTHYFVLLSIFHIYAKISYFSLYKGNLGN